MPIFTASAPRSERTTSICSSTNEAGIAITLATPRVFWAVSAVIAVIAKPPNMVIVLISAWMPAPPPESEPAMTRMRGGIIASPSRLREGSGEGRSRSSQAGTCPPPAPPASGRGVSRRLHRVADAVHHLLDQSLVLAFGHHPDQRLGPRFADDQPPRPLEPRLPVGDRRLDARRLERRAAAEADVLQELGQGVELVQHLARRLAALDEAGEDLQRRHQPVPGRRIVGEDDVAGLLAADIAAAR